MKRGLVQLALFVLFVLLAANALGQTPSVSVNPSQPYFQPGTLIKLSHNLAEIQIVDAPGKTPRMMTFVINENTKLNHIAVGHAVLVTYIKYPGKLVAIKLDAAGSSTPQGAGNPYGVAIGPVVDRSNIHASAPRPPQASPTPHRAINAAPTLAQPTLPLYPRIYMAVLNKGNQKMLQLSHIQVVRERTSTDMAESTRSSEVDSPSSLTPDVKQEISDEVNDQLALENLEAQQDIDPGSSRVSHALFYGHWHVHVFVVDRAMNVVSSSQATCALSDGDVLALVNPPHPNAIVADLVVLASKGGNECRKSSMVKVRLTNLQEMQSRMQDLIDHELQKYQNTHSKAGIPPAPPSALNRPAMAQSVVHTYRINGSFASVRTTEAKPEFYIYLFPNSTSMIANPYQFSLLMLQVNVGNREIALERAGSFPTSDNSNKTKIKFNVVEMSSHVYKVTMDSTLKPGEYAFVAEAGIGHEGSPDSVFIYDFGVDPN